MYSILISGGAGVGKSTLVRRVLDVVPDGFGVVGVLSGEVRIDGRRQGFTVRALDGPEGLLASPDLDGEPRFGSVMPDGRRRLGISLTHLDEDVCVRVERGLPAAQLVVIDELGAMQAESMRFRALVGQILISRIPLLATTGIHPHPWLDPLRELPDLALVNLTKNNRSALTAMLLSYTQSATSGVQ